jgi:hypothetical protein
LEGFLTCCSVLDVQRRLNGIDRHIRADNLTIMTVDTGIRLFHHGRTVPFDVVAVGELEDIPGTKGDAVTAALTAFFNDVDNPTGYLDFGRIERGPPIFHECPSFKPMLRVSCFFSETSRGAESRFGLGGDSCEAPTMQFNQIRKFRE